VRAERRRVIPLIALAELLVTVGAAFVQAGNGPLSPERTTFQGDVSPGPSDVSVPRTQNASLPRSARRD
jgi:hypothetical protein